RSRSWFRLRLGPGRAGRGGYSLSTRAFRCGSSFFRTRRGFGLVNELPYEHHGAHQEEGEQKPHFHRHFFGRLLLTVTAIYRFGHALKIPLRKTRYYRTGSKPPA